MNTVDFNNWLLSKGKRKKVASDTVSRLKRIDKELLNSTYHTTVDEQYNIDKCENLLNSFNLKYPDKKKLLLGSSLPINNPEIANYKSALKKYMEYLVSF